MAIISPSSPSLDTASDHLFAPADALLGQCRHQRPCPSLPDSQWIRIGVSRCLLPLNSGRGFLQWHASSTAEPSPAHSLFFAAHHSKRRLALLTELNVLLCQHAPRILPDALRVFPCLDGFEVHSGDGHFHSHATHDRADSQQRKHAVGHLNLIDSAVPPGVLAWLYKSRWDIEKSFDEIKNKLGEQKAWGSSATAKSTQAQFVCLTLNLLHLLEHELREKEGIANVAEDQRREKRLEWAREAARKVGTVLPKALEMVRRSTQHSVKFIRWVAAQLWRDNPWKAACAALATLYARL